MLAAAAAAAALAAADPAAGKAGEGIASPVDGRALATVVAPLRVALAEPSAEALAGRDEGLGFLDFVGHRFWVFVPGAPDPPPATERLVYNMERRDGTVDADVVPRALDRAADCDIFVPGTTYLVQRHHADNPALVLTVLFRLFQAIALDRAASDAHGGGRRVAVLDNVWDMRHVGIRARGRKQFREWYETLSPDGPVEFWPGGLYPPVDWRQRVCYERAVLTNFLHSYYLDSLEEQGPAHRATLRAFADTMISRFDLADAPQPDFERVVLVWRQNTTRTIQDVTGLVTHLRLRLAQAFPDRRIVVQLVALEDLPLRTQMHLMRTTRLLIGVHSGGLGQAIWMRPGSSILQILPPGSRTGTRRYLADCPDTFQIMLNLEGMVDYLDISYHEYAAPIPPEQAELFDYNNYRRPGDPPEPDQWWVCEVGSGWLARINVVRVEFDVVVDRAIEALATNP